MYMYLTLKAYPGTGVTSSCELSDVGAENQT